jgi:hypothetical protein
MWSYEGAQLFISPHPFLYRFRQCGRQKSVSVCNQYECVAYDFFAGRHALGRHGRQSKKSGVTFAHGKSLQPLAVAGFMAEGTGFEPSVEESIN